MTESTQPSLFDVASPDPSMHKELADRVRLANIDNIAHSCMTWADQAFPTRTDASMFLKMYGELAELIDAGNDCDDEIADILILVLDYASRKGVKPSAAVLAKLNVNRQREWEFTNIGTMQHVKDT